MKKVGSCAAALLVCLVLCLEQSFAAESGVPALNDELTKQKEIYLSRGEQRPEGYVIDRTLESYKESLPAAFEVSLANLGANGRWLDIGAGSGQAILDYFAPTCDMKHAEARERRGSNVQAVAISIEDRRRPAWHQTAASLGEERIRYLFNRSLREYSAEELGQFRVITDVIGGFSYTPNLSLFMEKVVALLEVNGSFFTVLQDVHSEAGANKPHYKGAPFLTEIAAADGSEVKTCNWLKSISCVKVTCEFRTGWTPSIEVYHLRKVCNEVAVPALVAVHYQAGTPPERGFQLRN